VTLFSARYILAAQSDVRLPVIAPAKSVHLCAMLRYTQAYCLTVLLTGSWQAGFAQAVVEGTVSLPAPPAGAAALPRYPGQTIQPGPPDPPTAVVYLEGSFPAASTNAPALRILGQKNLQFAPALLPVQKGTTVEFPNYDDLYHNVFSYSKTKRFDLGRYRKDERPAAQLFDKPGVIKLNCEIHEHMRGVILVLDTPYFTKTDTNGHYRLEGLPAGHYPLKAWLNEKTTRQADVDLETGKTRRVDFPAK
jgi:plastocyanin